MVYYSKVITVLVARLQSSINATVLGMPGLQDDDIDKVEVREHIMPREALNSHFTAAEERPLARGWWDRRRAFPRPEYQRNASIYWSFDRACLESDLWVDPIT